MQLDLNLLTALDALLEEGSVRGAARRLRLSEPATSRALGRIRQVLEDPILVRSGRRMMLTPRAEEIREEVHLLLERTRAVFTPPGKPDLSALDRTFSVLADDAAVSVGPELLDRMRAEAPKARLRFRSQYPMDIASALRDGYADLNIGPLREPTPPEIEVEPLVVDRMAAVVRPGHPLTEGTMTKERFAAAQHVALTPLSSGPVERTLSSFGLHRDVAMTVPVFGTGLFVVARSDLVGIVPFQSARRAIESLGLVRIEAPIELPKITMVLAWHKRHQADGGHRWLRNCVREIVQRYAST